MVQGLTGHHTARQLLAHLTATLAGKGSIGNLGKAGLIVLNKSQTTINNGFEGYYVGAIDNANWSLSSTAGANNNDSVRSC